jgi:hypothetical protein
MDIRVLWNIEAINTDQFMVERPKSTLSSELL